MVQEAAHDLVTVSHLLSQTLLAKQRAEEEAREAREVEELEADLASKEQQLLDEVERHQTSLTRSSRGSRVKVAALTAKLALGHELCGSSGKRKEEEEEESQAVSPVWVPA